MRLGIGITVIAAIAALGCDSPDPVPDGGGQPGVDSGPRADAAGGDEDGGGTDSGTPPPDGGPMTCSTTLPALAYEEVAPGYDWDSRLPVAVVQPPGEDEDLYVVDQLGEIVIVRDGSVLPTPFLRVAVDYSDDENERGLLGLAFHPDYATNGRFFVYYTRTQSGYRNILAEYHHTSGDVADATEVRRLVDIADPEWNHNGGNIVFGPDGFLYVAVGDGGGGGDLHGPIGNGLNRNTLLGKILRLDVDNAAGDFAAAGNPFSGAEGLPQIWAYGLRNPWRFSFDRMTRDLFIADVGQNTWEEIDIQPAASAGGENYGWAAYEATHVLRGNLVDEVAVHTEPVLEYAHGLSSGPIRDGCSVTGGFVYRGSAIPALRGWYLFGDFCSPDQAAFRYCDGEVVGLQRASGLDVSPGFSALSAFGQDNAGELYMVGFNYVVRIVAP